MQSSEIANNQAIECCSQSGVYRPNALLLARYGAYGTDNAYEDKCQWRTGRLALSLCLSLSVVDLRTISAGLGQGLGVERANRDNYHCGGELDMQ